MGVRGLTTYITSNENLFLKDFLLHDCNLVIDGHSLCAQLYQRLTSNSAFGGDYDKFAAFVRKFFLGLRKCKITSYVLFDGSLERKKLRTAFSRLRSKLNGVARLYPGNQSSLKIFPLLLRDVFKEVLDDLQIPYTVCEFEADDEIAALARHLNCPVLSYDSDFFIYNILYIPFNTFNIKPAVYEEEGNRFNAMECKLYSVEIFLDHFGGLEKELLPLLATLLGNDYVKKKVFRNFFSHLKIPKSRKKNEQQRSIQGVLEWLRNETLDTAVTKILGRLKSFQKYRVLNIIKKSCEGYSKTNCPSLKYFNLEASDNEEGNVIRISEDISQGSDDSESEASSDQNADDTSSDSSSVASSLEDVDTPVHNELELPIWIIEGIRQGKIPQPYINLYTHALYFCIPQAEDCNDKDCFLICLPMLRFAYDILTNFSEESLTYVSREGSQFSKIEVPINNYLGTAFESELNPLENLERMPEYFEQFVTNQLPGINFQCIEEAPGNFRLTLIAILWWIKHSRVNLAHIYSVLLCYVMLEVVDDKTGTPRGDFFFNNKHAKKLEEIKKSKPNIAVNFDESALFLNKNKVLYEDCLVAASVLLKLFEMESEMKKRPKTYDLQRIHAFAQFQCCLQQINYLNTLCNSKYDSTIYHKTYTGTLAYNLLNKLADRSDAMVYVEQLLKGADTVLLFFKSLCSVVDKSIKSLKLTLATPVVKVKQRRGRKKGKDINFICEGFESEVII